MKLLRTIHGFFSDERTYKLWCTLNNKKPLEIKQQEIKKDAFTINDDYDVERRERVEQ